MDEIKTDDIVRTPYGNGIVWKVSHEAVHVRHYKKNGDATFSKFYFHPTHYSQRHIICIKKISSMCELLEAL
jgi:hypothetical protein